MSGEAAAFGALVRSFVRYLKPYRARVALLALLLLIEMSFQAAVPLSFKFLVDRAVVRRDLRFLMLMLSALGIGTVLVMVGGLARDRLYARLGSRVLADIRSRMFSHLQRLSMSFYSRAQTGDVLSCFSSDLAAVEGAMAAAIPWGVLPALDVLASTVLLFLLDWRLACAAMLIWPLCLGGPRVFAPRASAASYRVKQEEAQTLSCIQENLSAQAVVKAFGLERPAVEDFERRNAALAESRTRFAFLSAMVERSAAAGIHVLQVLILGLGSYLAYRGEMTVGSLAAFQALFLSLSYSLAYVTQYVPSLLLASGGMRRIEELLAEQPQVVDQGGATDLGSAAREIVFQDVIFSYGGEQVSLDHVSFSIPQGASVAFVGSSGSGKSTVVNLLMRFYDPREGGVTVNGRELRSVSLDSLRASFGVVFQDNFLFNTTLRENIRVGKPAATDAEIESAARAAEIHDFISALPHGYDTPVGERGGRLSGGQRQRIAIARAILRDPAVLVLDEATSALDPATEAALNATLARVARGRTVVSVTHRLQSVAGADRIFVLDQGRLVEEGSHAELLDRAGAYRRLWDKQSGFQVSERGDSVRAAASRLQAFPILERLETHLLAELSASFVTERHPRDRFVIQQGDPGDKFYILVRGSVEVLQAAPGGADERLKVLEDGDYFGEIALLRDTPRTASVRTLCSCVFLTLQREQFASLISRAPSLRATLEQVAATAS
jgi:ATP-binding cassette subfamily B protein